MLWCDIGNYKLKVLFKTRAWIPGLEASISPVRCIIVIILATWCQARQGYTKDYYYKDLTTGYLLSLCGTKYRAGAWTTFVSPFVVGTCVFLSTSSLLAAIFLIIWNSRRTINVVWTTDVSETWPSRNNEKLFYMVYENFPVCMYGSKE